MTTRYTRNDSRRVTNVKKNIAPGILIFCLSFHNVVAQENKTPFTKAEILKALQPVPGKRVEQGDLAGEIATRGISFTIDEKTLEEFRKAGARGFVIAAIQIAAGAATTPKLPPRPTGAIPSENAVTDGKPSEEEIKRWPFQVQARYRAGMFIEELPNFISTQNVSRSLRTPAKKDWQLQDTLEIELTYNHKDGEKFKLLKINGRPSSQSYESVSGATSKGEFGGYIGALLDPHSQAQFKELRKEDFRGYKTVLYDFRILKTNSPHVLTD